MNEKCPKCKSGEMKFDSTLGLGWKICDECKHMELKLMSQSELNRIKSTKIDLGKYFNANGTGKII